ncbi:hypothetical protein [Hymenobacter sp. AT01-02]|uniref:hypothetical protein n=1 Tax=Hymenobacter sp. AT01-02 TaxID=1571877 RepID=UPI0005F0D945|nr:hypothetical protein [Hymenobacter sp. AT01-02]
MKFHQLLFAATFVLSAATATQAQTTPTSTQYGGAVNQTRVPPVNPANPVTNPGTIDQRTPTTASPTQSGVMGTIDQNPATVPMRTTPVENERSIRLETPATAPGTRRTTTPQGTLRRTTPATNTTTPRP